MTMNNVGSEIRQRRVEQQDRPDVIIGVERDRIPANNDHSLINGLSNYLIINLLSFSSLGLSSIISSLYASTLGCGEHELGACKEINAALLEGYYYTKMTTVLTVGTYIFHLLKKTSPPGTKTHYLVDMGHKITSVLGTVSGVYGIVQFAPATSRAALMMGTV